MAIRRQKAVVVAHFNKDHPEDAVEVAEKPIPTPKQGEALVRLLLRPINPSDLFSIGGIYGGFQPKLPATPGLEGMGKIEDLGPGPIPEGLPQRLKVGQRVVGVPWPAAEGEGTYQQYVAVPLEHLVPVADNLSDEDAAQFLVNPVTVVGFLEDLKVPKGKYLLQNAANSVLGKELISAAKHQGIQTINVVRRKEVVGELKALGADEVINSSAEDVISRVKEITGGEGAWAALNPIGGPASRAYPSSVRDGGVVYIYSMIGDDVHVPMYDEVFRRVVVRGWWLNVVAVVPMYDLHFRAVTVHGFWVSTWLESLDRQKREEKLQETMHLMAEGIIKPPPPSAKFPLDKVKEAIKTAKERSGKGGKVMLEG